MKRIEIVIPSAGESVSEGILARWLVEHGTIVQKGEPLFELETDKASLEVPSPETGVVDIRVAAESDVKIGDVVGVLEAIESDNSDDNKPIIALEQRNDSDEEEALNDGETLSPSVRRIVQEHKLDVKAIEGSGKDGRITKGDALNAVVSQRDSAADVRSQSDASAGDNASSSPKESEPARSSVAPTPTQSTQSSAGDSQSSQSSQPGAGDPHPSQLTQLSSGGSQPSQSTQSGVSVTPTQSTTQSGAGDSQRREKMSLLRRRIADNLVSSKQHSAHLTTFNEIDMGETMAIRQQYRDEFAESHGVKLGFMSFFVKAVCQALAKYPLANAHIDGDEIVYNDCCHIGVALSSPRGLMVPVIRHAEAMNFSQIEGAIVDFATRARDKKIMPDDLTGGTFTITNGGIFGSLLSTPIPNPPQSAILGMHTIKKRPIVFNDKIVARPMMYVALTYDHRILDGREAVGLLSAIKNSIEHPTRIMLGLS